MAVRITVLMLLALAFQTPLQASAAGQLDDAAAYWGQTVPGAYVVHDQAALDAYVYSGRPIALGETPGLKITVGDTFDQLPADCQLQILRHEYGHLLGLHHDQFVPADVDHVMTSATLPCLQAFVDASRAATLRADAAADWAAYGLQVAHQTRVLAGRKRCYRLRHSYCRFRFDPGPAPALPILPRP